MSASEQPVVMTPQLAARLIDAGNCGEHEPGIYEAIVGVLCTIDDEVHCRLVDVDADDDIVTRDVFITLTHEADADHAKEIADFFLAVGDHLSSMRFRGITVRAYMHERRIWSS